MQRGSKVQIDYARRQALATLDRCFNIAPGTVKINKGNTFEHELAKFCVAWEVAQLGKDFVTEAIFTNGKRADILVLDDIEAIEIQTSEKDESIIKKQEEYPVALRAISSRKVLSQALRSVGKYLIEANRVEKYGNSKNM